MLNFHRCMSRTLRAVSRQMYVKDTNISDKDLAMLDKNNSSYYNVQGTMIIDPAINSDVALVESKKYV